MKTYVADTHALYWHLAMPERLGASARLAFEESERGEAIILLPAIVLAELCWILEKQGRGNSFPGVFDALARARHFGFLDLRCEDLREFPSDAAVPEMHDRLIVGEARRHGAVLLTKDEEIVSSSRVPVAW